VDVSFSKERIERLNLFASGSTAGEVFAGSTRTERGIERNRYEGNVGTKRGVMVIVSRGIPNDCNLNRGKTGLAWWRLGRV